LEKTSHADDDLRRQEAVPPGIEIVRATAFDNLLASDKVVEAFALRIGE
jgi:hypothetical protein